MKQKKCKACGQPFTPIRFAQVTCYTVACSQAYGQQQAAKLRSKKARDEAKELRERKARAKTKADWAREAQAAFNRFIRLRDHDQPCISCGRVKVEWTRGGSWDCGHFLSRGAYPELRFEELNAHKQCKSCNAGSAKYAAKGRTVANEYEERLIDRIGQDKVDWLKGPHEPKHYTVDDLRAIRAEYTKRARELEKNP